MTKVNFFLDSACNHQTMKYLLIAALTVSFVVPPSFVGAAEVGAVVEILATVTPDHSWQSEGFVNLRYPHGDLKFIQLREWGQWYAERTTALKLRGYQPLMVEVDGSGTAASRVAIVNVNTNALTVYDLVFPQHVTTGDSSWDNYPVLVDEKLLVREPESSHAWFLFDPATESLEPYVDFSDYDFTYIDSSDAFKPFHMTNGALVFATKMDRFTDPVVWVHDDGSFEEVVTKTSFPFEIHPRLPGLFRNLTTSLFKEITITDEHDVLFVGNTNVGVYAFVKNSGRLVRVGHMDTETGEPRVIDAWHVSWIGEDGALYVAKIDAEGKSDNVFDVPTWGSFRTISDPTVYGYEYRFGEPHLVRYCSQRTFELAHPDQANIGRLYSWVNYISDHAEFERPTDCGGIPHYRPFKLASSPTVYYFSYQTGLVKYCSKESYIRSHNDPDFSWVIELDDQELDVNDPDTCLDEAAYPAVVNR